MSPKHPINWRDLYAAAYLERDPVKLAQRIDEAERAILQCQQEIAARTQDNDIERRALALCLHDLRVLRQRDAAGKRVAGA